MRKSPSLEPPTPVPGPPTVAESVGHARTVENKRLNAAAIAPPVNDARMRPCRAPMAIGNAKNCLSALTRRIISDHISNWGLRQLDDLTSQVNTYENLLRELYPRLDFASAQRVDQTLPRVGGQLVRVSPPPICLPKIASFLYFPPCLTSCSDLQFWAFRAWSFGLSLDDA